jgi:hypothetical protein
MGRMWVALLLVAAWSGAWAQPPDIQEQARAHFEAGHAMFRLERYADAAREFQAGYDLVPKPRFLLNLGHALRRMGLHDRAKATYEKFLASVPADDPDRTEAIGYLAEVTRKLGPPLVAPPPVVVPPPRSEPPPPRSEPPPPVTPAEPPRAEPAPPTPAPASVVAPREPSSRRAAFRRWAWTIPVGAVVIVGVALGAYFGSQSSSGSGVNCGDNAIDCLTVTP